MTDSAIDRGEKLEIGIGGFDGGSVIPRTGGDEHIDGRNRYAPRPCLTGQIVGLPPYAFVDGELGKRIRELPKNLSFPLSAGAVPQFQLHRGAPARLSAGQTAVTRSRTAGSPFGRSM